MELLAGRAVEAEDLAATRERTAAVLAHEEALKASDLVEELHQKAGDWAALTEQHRSLDVRLGRLNQLIRGTPRWNSWPPSNWKLWPNPPPSG